MFTFVTSHHDYLKCIYFLINFLITHTQLVSLIVTEMIFCPPHLRRDVCKYVYISPGKSQHIFIKTGRSEDKTLIYIKQFEQKQKNENGKFGKQENTNFLLETISSVYVGRFTFCSCCLSKPHVLATFWYMNHNSASVISW